MILERIIHDNRKGISHRGSIAIIEYERLNTQLDKISSSKLSFEQADREFLKLIQDVENAVVYCENEADRQMFKLLMDRVYRYREEYMLSTTKAQLL